MTDRATPEGSAPGRVDRGFQAAYTCAYRMMRIYWRLRHPTTHGSLVALWNRGEVLLVRNSYVPYYSLPGGYVRGGETPQGAALRELSEEVGISAKPEHLELVLEQTHEWEGKHDHVHIFGMIVSARPVVAVDHREVVEASWWLPERALSLDLFPPLRRMLESRGDSGRS
ncbi:MAG: NUDIX hydrolase [Myxococcota bacterium]|nr:NUDIX hydrolase [Myxococcota bacterium]